MKKVNDTTYSAGAMIATTGAAAAAQYLYNRKLKQEHLDLQINSLDVKPDIYMACEDGNEIVSKIIDLKLNDLHTSMDKGLEKNLRNIIADIAAAAGAVEAGAGADADADVEAGADVAVEAGAAAAGAVEAGAGDANVKNITSNPLKSLSCIELYIVNTPNKRETFAKNVRKIVEFKIAKNKFDDSALQKLWILLTLIITQVTAIKVIWGLEYGKWIIEMKNKINEKYKTKKNEGELSILDGTEINMHDLYASHEPRDNNEEKVQG